jgi:hypothetical protein
MLKRTYSRMVMTVTLHFSNETEQRLRGLATRAGLTLEGYLQSLAEREAAVNGSPPSASGEWTPSQWSSEWRAWADADRHLPSGIAIDDSRDTIYAGRGE